jgi:hypothetical protein
VRAHQTHMYPANRCFTGYAFFSLCLFSVLSITHPAKAVSVSPSLPTALLPLHLFCNSRHGLTWPCTYSASKHSSVYGVCCFNEGDEDVLYYLTPYPRTMYHHPLPLHEPATGVFPFLPRLRIHSSKHDPATGLGACEIIFGPLMDDADEPPSRRRVLYFSLKSSHPHSEYKLTQLVLGQVNL